MLTRYTTAPDDYDGFGTRTIGIVGYDSGKPVRQVEIHPEHLRWQESRYGSGMHAAWKPEEFERLARAPWFVARKEATCTSTLAP